MNLESETQAAVFEVERILEEGRSPLAKPVKLLEIMAQKTQTLLYEVRDFVKSFSDEDVLNEEVPPAIIFGVIGTTADFLVLNLVTAFAPVDSTVAASGIAAGTVAWATFGGYLGYKDYLDPPERHFASED